GGQRLLAGGELPPEIVYAHPGFLRPCAGLAPAGGRYLPLYAADLVRGPDGTIMVLADRTQAPSGVGYALENRIVLSRALGDVFRDSQVARLATFFATVRDTLRGSAPRNRDGPRIVLLTPGPYNATYFEQAFLAQYLDMTLARGDDLVVRDERVYLKQLGGLKPVDVILRRVNDDFCDPLELRADSSLGVPGLVQAIRAGNVAVANPLGSGILQTSAILPYLPALCRSLLGEELKMPSVPTQWCGEPGAVEHVVPRLSALVVKPAFPVGPTLPIFGPELAPAELAALRDRIRARPREYVAQHCVLLSTVPTLGQEGLSPAPLWMRVYAVAAGDDYQVMPGALSRVGRPGESYALSLRPGGESKDTWVLAPGPISTFTLLPSPGAPVELSRGGGDLPSRIADNLFWLGRYAERTEGTARLARSAATRMSDENAPTDGGAAALALLAALEATTRMGRPSPAGHEASSPRGAGSGDNAADERFLFAVVHDDQAPGSLVRTAAETHRVARTIRDWISADTWRAVAELNQELSRPRVVSARSGVALLVTLLDRVIMVMAALRGLAAESMTHGHAWRFLEMGRRLERGLFVVGLLRATLARSPDAALLEELLQIADSAMTYRRRYLAALQDAPVVDLLLTDETNPRSVVFQVERIAEHVDALPRDTGKPRSAEQSLVLSARAELRLADISELCALADRRPLLDLLARVGSLLRGISDALAGTYFNHAVAPRQMR
ncbi:MAG: circularly permuted type 2 ATP-grasp protein, partial [Myxococcales bacterium]|nr:circularly permuted type 2 ATP-grasp protein [Myxococcales bacterium]